MTTAIQSTLATLSAHECRRLLATACVGRLGFVHEGVPEILPVNYALDGDAVVFATATGLKLWEAGRGTVVFEVDHTDPVSRRGWSVVIHGLAQEITDAEAPALLGRLRALELHPWVGDDRPHLVRIAPSGISGRRVGTPVPTPVADSAPGTMTELTREECFSFLRSLSVGRLAVAAEDGPPLVVPVNFVVDGEAILFRSDPGLKLRLLRKLPISFQADYIDPFHHSGHSVLAHGIGYEASHWETDHIQLEPWAAGPKKLWVRMVVDAITGRRLMRPDVGWPASDRGYL